MTRVRVVCTVHRETGLANASELQAFLERFKPEVIFLELPSVGFDRLIDSTGAILESTAASRYRALHPVTLVPVDVPLPEVEFARNINYLFGRVEDASPEYCRLTYLHSQYVSTHGFAYLNSGDGTTLWSSIQKEMRGTVEQLDDPGVRDLYGLWEHANELRETRMVQSIVDYAKHNPFNTAVFFVGLAHRQSIMHKARLAYGDGPPTVQWDFGGFLEPAGDSGGLTSE
jgi:hypothetical protein